MSKRLAFTFQEEMKNTGVKVNAKVFEHLSLLADHFFPTEDARSLVKLIRAKQHDTKEAEEAFFKAIRKENKRAAKKRAQLRAELEKHLQDMSDAYYQAMLLNLLEARVKLEEALSKQMEEVFTAMVAIQMILQDKSFLKRLSQASGKVLKVESLARQTAETPRLAMTSFVSPLQAEGIQPVIFEEPVFRKLIDLLNGIRSFSQGLFEAVLAQFSASERSLLMLGFEAEPVESEAGAGLFFNQANTKDGPMPVIKHGRR